MFRSFIVLLVNELLLISWGVSAQVPVCYEVRLTVSETV